MYLSLKCHIRMCRSATTLSSYGYGIFLILVFIMLMTARQESSRKQDIKEVTHGHIVHFPSTELKSAPSTELKSAPSTELKSAPSTELKSAPSTDQYKITKYTIYGERCSGTNYLQTLIDTNFNVKLTWEYDWKHFFGFNELENSDNTLFICIVRNEVDWLNSLYRKKWHLALKLKNNLSDTERLYQYLNEEHWSYFDQPKEHKEMYGKEIMKDRNIYTGKRYANIFELRFTKIKYMLETLPKKVRHYVFIRHEDLLDNFEETMLNIKNMGLEVKDNIVFPSNTDKYKGKLKQTYTKKKNSIPASMIQNNPNRNPYYEDLLYGPKIDTSTSLRSTPKR